MKFLHLFFCFLILFGCSSVEKRSYEDRSPAKDSEESVEGDKKSFRDIAQLKNLSVARKGQFQFVIKQMKEVIVNYSEMKRQLLKIEDRLNRILVRNVVKQQSQTDNQTNVQVEPQTDNQTAEQAKDATGSGEGEVVTSSDKEETTTSNNEGIVASPMKEDELKDTPASDPSPLLQEDITDNKDIFTDETKEDTSYIQNQQKALEKIAPKDKSSNQQKPLSLMEAEKLFKKRSYENAISAFQKYRDENPSGQYYPEATFYIGQSFKELKMPIEAKVFFQEIVSSYPKSLWANRSQKILKE